MRASLERYLNETWYGDRRPGAVLLALERVYARLSTWHRRFRYRRRDRDLEDRPILVVGNLTAGGSGKTPFVIRLCELAISSGLTPGVISRGYGRRSRQALRVTADMDPRDTGDEPYLIAQRCSVPVQVDVKRENAARSLLMDGVNLVISDDGLQRASMPRLLEVCILDQEHGFGNGRMLPAGPLRESPGRLESVDFIVENQSAGSRPFLAEGYVMRLHPGRLAKLHGDQTMPLEAAVNDGRAVHAVAGIARPQRFFEMLESFGVRAIAHPFADHHRFLKSDFDSIPVDAMIIMTEKDAVKCRRLPLRNAWYLPVEAVLSESLEAALLKTLEAMANKYGSN